MKKLYTLLLVVLALMACDRKEPETTNGLKLIDDQSKELQFDGWAASESISFYAPVNWMISIAENAEWFSVTPAYGPAGEQTITIEVFDYSGEEKLSGSFDIMAGDERLTISVSQRSAMDPDSDYFYIPDAKFEKFLVENFDTDGDGKVSKAEAAEVRGIAFNDLEVESIEGIKYFTSLQTLDCSYNTIRGEVDLSGMNTLTEVYVDHNYISSLNLAGCSHLAIVEANDNVERLENFTSYFHLKNVNVEGCESLLYLELTDSAIEEIDLSDCTKLQVLRMTWNNLKSIDVTNNPELTHLYVRKNPELTGVIDLSNNTKLQEVWCAESKVQGLNLSNDHSSLNKIVSYYSEIESLDLSTCPNLTYLEAHGMKLKAIDLTPCPELSYLWLKFNEVAELDLTNCTKIQEVQIGYNKIEKLDMSKCPEIMLLEVASNALTEVNLEGCTKLQSLDVSMNQLTEIDLSDCGMLFSATVHENQLTKLDVSEKPELVVLSCSFNMIEEINTVGCRDLRWLYADNNKLSHLDLRANSAIEELALTNNELVELLVSGLQSLSLCEFNGNKLERLDLSGCPSVYELYVHDNPLAYFSVQDCTALYQIDIRRTNMKSIDLSKNKNVAFVFAEENPQLKTIYIHPEAPINTISCDEHVEIYLYDPVDFDDVNSDNWGDEDINPWHAA